MDAHAYVRLPTTPYSSIRNSSIERKSLQIICCFLSPTYFPSFITFAQTHTHKKKEMDGSVYGWMDVVSDVPLPLSDESQNHTESLLFHIDETKELCWPLNSKKTVLIMGRPLPFKCGSLTSWHRYNLHYRVLRNTMAIMVQCL